MTSLSGQLAELHEKVIDKIKSLIEVHGVESDGYNFNVLSLEEFTIDRNFQDVKRIEILIEGYKVLEINDSVANCENGHQYNIQSLLDESLEELCQALDSFDYA